MTMSHNSFRGILSTDYLSEFISEHNTEVVLSKNYTKI